MSEQARPVTSSERMASMDVLRGFALLGILTMNILSLGLPSTARLNPYVAGGFTGINYFAWLVGYFLFDEKMITIFSMLFGAGLVLMTDRSNQPGRSTAALYYRRVGILLVIGLIHAYLIWDGDILVSYALCGMLAYPLRTLSPRTLIIVAVLAMLPSVPLTAAVSRLFQSFREASVRVQVAARQGEAASPMAGTASEKRFTPHHRKWLKRSTRTESRPTGSGSSTMHRRRSGSRRRYSAVPLSGRSRAGC